MHRCFAVSFLAQKNGCSASHAIGVILSLYFCHHSGVFVVELAYGGNNVVFSGPLICLVKCVRAAFAQPGTNRSQSQKNNVVFFSCYSL